MHVAVAGDAFIAKLVGEAVGVLVMVVIAGSGWRWGDKSGSARQNGRRDRGKKRG